MVNENEGLFRTVMGDSEAKIEEKRSTFIGAVKRVSTVAEAEAFIKARKKMHPDARHTVFAYLLRDGNKRYGDDSEPQGTAGMPTLKAIEQRGLADVCVATTRYFGGILLGAGGLTRAYSAAAHAALEMAGVAEYIPFTDVSVRLTYADYQRLLQELPRFEARERATDFAEHVTLTVGLPATLTEAFLSRVTDLSAGRAVTEVLKTALDAKPI
ncbi:MAG: YigZ family protein [Clostridia bacterium]|nr:YigZ family protein [Clostridia bacterium]